MDTHTCGQQTTYHYNVTQLPEAVQDQWVDHNLPYVWVGASFRSSLSTERKTLLISRKPTVLHMYMCVCMMYKNWSHLIIFVISAESCQYCRTAHGSSALVIIIVHNCTRLTIQVMQYTTTQL